MSAFFITATGTDIGKTYLTCGVIESLRARGRPVEALKPVVSGFDPDEARSSDPGRLLAALGRPVTLGNIARISPFRFAAPLSPDQAARREGRRLDFASLVGFCRDALAASQGTLLIEGVGGAMAPLDDAHTVLDWMAALGLPLVLVTGSYLGTLSHTLTAVDVVKRRGLTLATLVVSESEHSSVPLADNIATLERFLPGVRIAVLPRQARIEPDRFADILPRG